MFTTQDMFRYATDPSLVRNAAISAYAEDAIFFNLILQQPTVYIDVKTNGNEYLLPKP